MAILLGPTVAAAQAPRPAEVPVPVNEAAQMTPQPITGLPGMPPPPGVAPPAMNPVPAHDVPAVVPLDFGPNGPGIPQTAVRPKVLSFPPDSTGLVPEHPPGPVPPIPQADAAKKVDALIEVIRDPEAEIAVVVGRTKLIETRRVLTRIAISDPSVADVEILADQPNSRLLNVYGRRFGTTTMTLWDADDKPLTFLLRVTLDTRDLESRIKQAFPGSQVIIRQAGPQIILEGQVADSKSMAEILQIVSTELRFSGGFGMMGGMGGGMGGGGGGMAGGGGAAAAAGGGAGGGMGGGGMAGGGMGGGGMGGGGMMGGGMMGGGMSGGGANMMNAYIVNRVHVPGPRQILLHVKLAELNRTATRQLGVDWLYARNNKIIGSPIGGSATFTGNAGPIVTTGSSTGGKAPLTTTFNSLGEAVNSSSTLYGIFDAGHFSLFLNALRSNSLAKILAEPNLMALDGQPARFLAGGLFPYPVPQSSSIPGGTAVVTVQFANFGAILSFLPQILANDVIRLDVEPVFSQLNFGAGTTINGGPVPAIDQRSARTVVEMREGQTLAIAGLLQSTTNASTNRIPGLGDLPLVGNLFSYNQIETVETELLVLVTPELVAPMEANEVGAAPGDRVLQPNDFEFYFLGRIEGKLGRDFRATVREHDPLDVMKHYRSEESWVIGPHGLAD